MKNTCLKDVPGVVYRQFCSCGLNRSDGGPPKMEIPRIESNDALAIAKVSSEKE